MTEQNTAPRLRQNVVKTPWHFRLHFADGRTEEMTVEARDFSAAIFSLPRFCEVGKFKYELVNRKGK